MKVLVIEDDLHTRNILSKILGTDLTLKHLDLQVFQAADGLEGLDLYREHYPDLVITDLLMPRVDGFIVIDTIRKDPRGKECQILVMSAVYRDAATLGKLRKTYDVHLQSKPFIPQVMARKIHKLLQKVSPDPTLGLKPQPLAKLSRGAQETHQESRKEPQQERTGSATMEGEISPRKSVPRLLLEILERQSTGTLDLRRDKIRKVVHIMSGHPLFVQSNLRSETLGQMMIRRGILMPRQHTVALTKSKSENIKYGEALVRLRYLTEGEVMSELHAQTTQKLEACLRWKRGSWQFNEDPEVGSKVPHCTVDPVSLVLDGLQSSSMEDAFVRVAGASGKKITLLPRFDLYRERFQERFGGAVIDTMAGGITVAQVIKTSGDAHEAVTQIDLLLQTGLAELQELPVSSAVEVGLPPTHNNLVPLNKLPVPKPEPMLAETPPEAWEEDSAVVWMSLEERPKRDPSVSPEEVKIALQLIHSTYLGLHDADHYQVLGVTSSAEVENIEVAYQIKRKQFDLSNFRNMDLGDQYSHLEEIGKKLDQAFAVLSNLEQRKRYDATLSKEPSSERNLALDAEDLCSKGEELLEREDYEEAAALFARAAELDEQAEYYAKHALAFFHANRQSFSETQLAAQGAMIKIQQALSIDPENTTALMISAAISRQLGHNDEAYQNLKLLLKIDPCDREAFREAERILMETGNLEDLELFYRRTIHLLGDLDRPWSIELWYILTRFYRDKLKDTDKFRTACKVVLRMDPEDREMREMLAALDHESPDQWPQAVLGYRSLLRSDPGSTEPLHQLFHLHHEAGRLDAALVAAGTARLRGVADAGESAFLDQHAASGLRRMSGLIEPAHLESLRHPDDLAGLANLFRLLEPIIHEMFPMVMADLDLTPSDLVSRDDWPRVFSSMLIYVFEQLDMELPRVAIKPDLGLDIQAAGINPPLLLVGNGALFQTDQVTLCFKIARAAALLSPGRRLVPWHPRRLLRSFILASLVSTFPSIEVPDPDGEVEKIRPLCSRPEVLMAIQDTVVELRKHFHTLNLGRWQQGIQRTADRVGLLLCADLEVAAQVVASGSQEAEHDLIDFALGEIFGDLRRRLGIALERQA